MKKPWYDADRLIFVGKTCLVASILMGIILIGRASYTPTISSTITKHTSIEPVSKQNPLPTTHAAHLAPPKIDNHTTMRLDIVLSPDRQHKQASAFCIRVANSKKFLVSNASSMTQGEWDQVSHIIFTGLSHKQVVGLDAKPVFVGTLTEDNQPNLLLNPDLGQDLVLWPMPAVTFTGLVLATTMPQRNEDVWIIGAPDGHTQNPSLYRCRVLEVSEQALSIQPTERVSIEKLIGLPVINQQKEVVGTVLGGNDLVFIGASAPALSRRLISLDSK